LLHSNTATSIVESLASSAYRDVVKLNNEIETLETFRPKEKRKKIKVKVEEVEKMRSVSSPSLTIPSRSKKSLQIQGNGMRRSRMVKVGRINIGPSPALSIPVNNGTKRKKSITSQLLSADEELQLTSAISDLRRSIRIRNDLSVTIDKEPSEKEWASACGLTHLQLRHLLQNGENARAKLIAKNGGLVVSIAKRYHNRNTGSILTLQDIIQEGNLGLMVAAERFDPSRGFKFATYAGWWVRQRILRCIADHSRVIRLPTHVISKLGAIDKTRKTMSQEIGRVPSIPELAHRLGMPVEKLKMYTDANRHVLSLERPLNLNSLDDSRVIGDGIASDVPSPQDNIEGDCLRQDIRAVIDELSVRERDVLVFRYGLDDGSPKTIDEVASRLNLSRERVRLFEARAINKLRHPGRHEKLKEYVGSIEEPETKERTPEEIWSF